MGGFETIDPRFTKLYERAVEVLGRDPRVISVTPSGSVGGGTADAWSDLDITIVATEDGYDAFLADWPSWLAEITPTVFARTPIAPMVINTVTDEGLTFDIAVWKGAPLEFPPAAGYTVGMLSGLRFDDVGAALEYAVAEQLRGIIGPFISLLGREEHLRHLTGVPHLLGLLTTVFLAETGAPQPGKHWNGTYTEEQRAAVAALPPVSATREGIMAFGLGLSELLLTRARPLFDRYGLEWPAPLAATAAARVRDQLGLDLGAWLH
jgi:hypothetical protein